MATIDETCTPDELDGGSARNGGYEVIILNRKLSKLVGVSVLRAMWGKISSHLSRC